MPREYEVLFPYTGSNGVSYPYYNETLGMWIPPPPIRQLGVGLPCLLGRDLSGDDLLYLSGEDLSAE